MDMEGQVLGTPSNGLPENAKILLSPADDVQRHLLDAICGGCATQGTDAFCADPSRHVSTTPRTASCQTVRVCEVMGRL
jgi:hypothetical protein